MLSTGLHTWTVSTSVCVCQSMVRSAYKRLEMTELCFTVVELLNSVVKTNVSKCDFGDEMNQMEMFLHVKL